MSSISVKELRFAYLGAKEMQFDFGIERGSRLAILGPSGSGKSTLLHLLCGFETPHTGTIKFGGEDCTFSDPGKRPVSMIFQDNNLFGHLSIFQNTGLGLAPRLDLSRSEKSLVEAALERVGLDQMGKRLPFELSGGERQRAALARCLLRDKPVLLLDEPFAALGPAMRLEMLDLVKELQIEKSMTIVMVTHNPDDAVHFATKIGFVDDTKMVGTLPVSALNEPDAGSGLEKYLKFERHAS